MTKAQNESEEDLNEDVADLPVSNEQAAQTKGGLTMNFGKIVIDYQEQDHKL